jgi:hypothetical protein
MLVFEAICKNPVLGGKIEEADQAFPDGSERFHRLGLLGLVVGLMRASDHNFR